MSTGWEPGSVCPNCPHPLDEHKVEFLERTTLLVCKADGLLCDCVLEHEHGKPNFNQQAIDALGIRARDRGESKDDD